MVSSMTGDDGAQSPAEVGYRAVTAAETQRANRADWDATADDYQREHGSFLRDVGFIWCPEGLDEADKQLEDAQKKIEDSK